MDTNIIRQEAYDAIKKKVFDAVEKNGKEESVTLVKQFAEYIEGMDDGAETYATLFTMVILWISDQSLCKKQISFQQSIAAIQGMPAQIFRQLPNILSILVEHGNK